MENIYQQSYFMLRYKDREYMLRELLLALVKNQRIYMNIVISCLGINTANTY